MTFCCSVAYHSVSSCVDDLDESRSLQLKSLLSEYFDKRRDRSQTLAPLDIEELDKYKVKHTGCLPGASAEFERLDLVVYLCTCAFTVVRLGESDQSRHQRFSQQPK